MVLKCRKYVVWMGGWVSVAEVWKLCMQYRQGETPTFLSDDTALRKLAGKGGTIVKDDYSDGNEHDLLSTSSARSPVLQGSQVSRPVHRVVSVVGARIKSNNAEWVFIICIHKQLNAQCKRIYDSRNA